MNFYFGENNYRINRIYKTLNARADGLRRLEAGAGAGHLRSTVCREARRASGAAMAIAPDGPKSLELAGGGNFSFIRYKRV